MFNIIIVDDEKIIRQSVKSKILRIKNPNIGSVLLAQDGLEAINLIETNKIDIAFVDIKMPGMSGLELIEKISVIDHSIEFIIISGFDDFDYVRKAFTLGVYDYILKPVGVSELKERLNSLLIQLDFQNIEIIKNKKISNLEITIQGCNTKVEIAKSYIRNNFYRDLPLAEVANSVSMNYSYFSQLFKEETGLSFCKFLTEVRMETALELLKNPLNSIGEISEKVGYKNQYHFSRSFKVLFGKPPSEYRLIETVDSTLNKT